MTHIDNISAAVIIDATRNNVNKLLNEGQAFRGTGHDWWHTYRVWKMALHIAEVEAKQKLQTQRKQKHDSHNIDIFIVEMSALLHDIDDWKFRDNNSETEHAPLARGMLAQFHLDNATVDTICEIVANISFKGACVASKQLPLEGQIVQDADRLDAIGAIGIARTFAYGGYKKREIYDPNIQPQLHASFAEYQNANGASGNTTINHFYEKLLLLKSKMNTKIARNIAEQRHKYMERFLKQFFTEWDAFEINTKISKKNQQCCKIVQLGA
jgi:uncharacterized protein